ncbi:type II-A CRISPR-associated protein Csn2 [Romboutsia sedimentorum]|uniref:Type II-A CRISPR-associated protein Csn2 n=1 Tax=Romboutsia sedimentorum TaxID=1368474 RepID=A0ABT7E8M5_9FIRM|nr:type II-A CRISPR-associated protein Csn2 [Romboutsia sedimentorum]MDK2563280.1 type II-A CRISPR-associated protein Csn2 [Romboutsia sedimentorum]
MITLRFVGFENLVIFDERYVNLIEIAEKELFKKTVYIINKYSKNIEDGNDIVLLSNDNRLEISKNILVVNDFYNIDINSNKILKALYNEVEIQYNYEYGEENLLKNLENIFSNLHQILCSYDFEVEYKRELKVAELLKCVGLKFNEYYYDNPLDNLICLFDLISLFKLYKIIVLVNMKLFFNDEEIVEIYKSALHRNINLLILEHGQESKLLEYESKIYIDNDFDEFVLKK